MPYLWERIERGRYAAHYGGCLLEVVRNPDFPEDNRRYQPCVNHHPIDTPKHALKAAQTAAVQYVERLKLTATPAAQERQEERRRVEVLRIAEQAPPPEPEVRQAYAVYEPVEEPRTVTFTISGTVTTTDHIRAMADIRDAVEMLRHVADTKCRIIPPDFIDL